MPDPSSFSEHAGSHANGASANGAARHTNGVAKPNGPAAAPAQEDEISVREIVDTVLANKWLVLGCFLVVLALACLYTFLKTPEYEASSVVYVKSQSAPQIGQVLGLGGQQQNVANEVGIMRSRAIAKRVAGELMKQRYPSGTQELFTVLEPPEGGEELTKINVANRLMGDYVEIAATGVDVSLIRTTVRSTMPAEAALIADLYAQEYAAYDQDLSGERAQKSRELLADAVKNFQNDIQQTEGELRSFMDEQQVVAPEKRAAGQIELLQNLQQQRSLEQVQQETERMRKRQYQDELSRIAPGLSKKISEGDALVVNTYGKRIAELKARLTQKYAVNPGLEENPEQDPDVVETKEKIASLQAQVEQRANRMVESAVEGKEVGKGRIQDLSERILSSQVALQASEAKLDMLDQRTAALRQELGSMPQKQITVDRLQRTLKSNQQVFTELNKKYYDARIAAQAELGKVAIIDEAVVPEKPVRPIVPLNLAFGALLGLMLGVGGAFVRNALDDKVHDPEGLRKHGHSVLGTVPDMRPLIQSDFEGRERVSVDGRQYDTHLMALLNPLSPLSERYRQLRTHVQFSRPDSRVQTVMLTSSGPGEGKSVTAANLAVAMAQAGRRTLYLDADLRRATGHRLFDVPREPGLVDLLFDAPPGDFERFGTGVDNLYVMPAGSSVPNPSEILGSEKMGALVERLRGAFDTVVIDTPPVLAVTDPLLVSKHCDVTVLVCSADETEWQNLQRSTEELGKVGTRVAGTVLNRFDARSSRDGYGYGYGTDGEEADRAPKSFGSPVNPVKAS